MQTIPCPWPGCRTATRSHRPNTAVLKEHAKLARGLAPESVRSTLRPASASARDSDIDVYDPDLSYQQGHSAPGRADGENDSLFQIVSGTGDMLPSDVLEHPDWYGAMHEETVQTLRRVSSPDDLVTIYRAVPDDVHHINSGDWVTLSRAYAQGHSDAGNITGQVQGHIISAQVPAKYLYTDGVLEEWGLDSGFHIDTRDGSTYEAFAD